LVEQKELAIRPDVGAIVRNVHRNVADDADALSSASAEFLPLPEKFVLKEFLGVDGGRQSFRPALHGFVLAPSDVGGPPGPRDQVVDPFTAMNSAKSSSQVALAWENPSNRQRSSAEALAKKLVAAFCSSGALNPMTAP